MTDQMKDYLKRRKDFMLKFGIKKSVKIGCVSTGAIVCVSAGYNQWIKEIKKYVRI
jgi:hypothetical protein